MDLIGCAKFFDQSKAPKQKFGKVTSSLASSFDLQANLFMKRRDSTSTKLNILGVKQQVNEVKKVNFHVNFEKYSLKSHESF